MDASKLNPAGFYEFRLGHGTIATRDGTRMLMVSDTIAQRLLGAALAQGDAATLRAWGVELGVLAASAAGHRVDGLSAEGASELLSSVFALAGLGHVTLERWGDVAAVRLDSALSFDAAPEAYEALFAGIFESLMEVEVAVVPAPGARFLLVHPVVAEQVRQWFASGAAVADVASRLIAQEQS